MLLRKQTKVKEKILLAGLGTLAPLTLSTSFPAYGQISPDGTVPTNVTGADGRNFTINGGAQAGGNLFHSFRDFSVPTGGSAFFNNGADINNIINRVTGGSLSNIDGLLRANGAANLFLINPAGIVFGPNARLDIGGSFMGTTASGLLFADGTEFGVFDGTGTPLLTVSQPVGLQFRGTPGEIRVQGGGEGIRTTPEIIDTTVGLRVGSDRTLALVGGDLVLEGGTLKTTGGRIELGSVGDGGSVSLTPTSNGWTLGYENAASFRDIQLSQRASVDASGAGGGDIQVRGRGVTMADGSRIESSTLGAQPGGTVTVNAEYLEITGSSNLYSVVISSATGKGSDLIIKAERLVVRDGGIASETVGDGNAGNVIVDASELEVNSSRISSSSRDLDSINVNGNAGNISINANSLIIRNFGLITSETKTSGNAGNININASEVEIDSSTIISNSFSIEENANISVGDAGNIIIDANSLIVRNGGMIASGTTTSGSAGNISIESEYVEVTDRNSAIASDSIFTPENANATVGNAGNVVIDTNRLIVRNQGSIFATTTTSGNSGDIDINASEVEVDNSLIKGTSLALGENNPQLISGNAGNINIEANRLIVRNGGQILSNTETSGNAGSININASQLNIDERGVIAADTSSNGSGGEINIDAFKILMRNQSQITTGTLESSSNAGSININTSQLVVRDVSLISSSTIRGDGDAGSISINASEFIEFRGNAGLNVLGDIGDAGSVIITTDRLTLQDSGNVVTGSSGTGKSGNLTVKASEIEVIGFGSGLIASTLNLGENTEPQGRNEGGNLTIITDRLTVRDGGNISVSSLNQDNAGNIHVTASEFVRLSGTSPDGIRSRLGANAGTSPTGGTGADSGSITIRAGQLIVEGGAIVEANNLGSGNAGNLEVTAGNIQLDSGILAALANSGGNITLNVPEGNINMRGSSGILASAFETGGNVNINTQFLIASPGENNDITANADGTGGRIDITANGVFGIEFRDTEAPGFNNTNDITASSTFGRDGEVTFSSPDVDLSAGLVELSDSVLDSNAVVARACPTNTEEEETSTFEITGRGGLPPNPANPLTGETIRVGGVSESDRAQTPPITVSQNEAEIVPARGWMVNEEGVLVLTSYATPNSNQRSANPPKRCP